MDINLFSKDSVITGILLMTFLYAIVLHYAFEQQYLRWDRKVVAFAVVVLCLLNGGAFYKLRGFRKPSVFVSKLFAEKLEQETVVSELDIKVVHGNTVDVRTKFNYRSDFDLDIVYGYENKTKGKTPYFPIIEFDSSRFSTF